MWKTFRLLTFAVMATVMGAAGAAGESIRIAFIDPLSGAFATTGNSGLAQYRYAAETLVNAKGGVLGGKTFEIVPFDNKISPKESLIQLQVAIDQGIRFIAQGNSSDSNHFFRIVCGSKVAGFTCQNLGICSSPTAKFKRVAQICLL